MGGVAIDRRESHGFVDQIIAAFNSRDEMIFAITPEGTRKKTEFWKSGFYHIALEAHVPVALAYMDYSRREMGLQQPIFLTGDPGRHEPDACLLRRRQRPAPRKARCHAAP